MKHIIKLMRPKHWVKNILVFAALVFSKQFTDIESVKNTVIAFMIFSITASLTYVINDLRDIDADKAHPVKSQKRPLAYGGVSVPAAYVLIGVLLVVLAAGLYILPAVLPVIGAYVIINIFYNLGLKHVAIVDLFIISAGFILRAFAGATAISQPISDWMLVTIMSLTLFLACLKRRQEIITAGTKSRKVLQHYSIEFLDTASTILAGATFLFYSLYVVLEYSQLKYTIPFVLFGLLRYILLLKTNGGEDPTEELLTDKPLFITVLAYGLFVIIILGKGILYV